MAVNEMTLSEQSKLFYRQLFCKSTIAGVMGSNVLGWIVCM